VDQLGNILGEREGVASDGWPKTTAPSCFYRPSQRQGDVHQPVHEPLRSSRPWRDQPRQPFGEHAACAVATGAKELPYLQVEHNTALRQPRPSPAQGATRETALALVGTAWCVRSTRRVAQPIACPDGMDEAQCAQLPDGLKVRELRYRVQRQGFRVKAITLGTTLVDAERYSVQALSQLYVARWGIETHCAQLKTPKGLDGLKCKTVDGVLKELL